MKKKLLLILLFLFSIMTFSQEVEEVTYRFINPTLVKDISQYRKAFSTADMTKFRYKDKSNFIEFLNGLKVEIFSAEQLIRKGVKVNLDRILVREFKEGYVLKLSDDGNYILQQFTAVEFKSRKLKK
ncbi:hypothetical protein [Flavobacterium sediminis]|nr:hypothetical protein [Flavobacterium sediminis]